MEIFGRIHIVLLVIVKCVVMIAQLVVRMLAFHIYMLIRLHMQLCVVEIQFNMKIKTLQKVLVDFLTALDIRYHENQYMLVFEFKNIELYILRVGEC